MAITPQDKSTPVELKAMIHPSNSRRIAELAQSLNSDHDYTVNALLSDWFSSQEKAQGAAPEDAKKRAPTKTTKPQKPAAKSAAAGGN